VADKTALVSNKEATRRNQVGTDEIILPKTIAFESILNRAGWTREDSIVRIANRCSHEFRLAPFQLLYYSGITC